MSSVAGSFAGGSSRGAQGYGALGGQGVLGKGGSLAQVVSWVAPVVSSGLTRTVVHFFPAARGVASPYSVSCRLTLFGGGIERRSVVLEGARLNQPDGLFVDEAFPELPEMVQAAALPVQAPAFATPHASGQSSEQSRLSGAGSSGVSSIGGGDVSLAKNQAARSQTAGSPTCGRPAGGRLDGCLGYAGIELELFTDQPRVDMSPSRCVFEYHSGVNVVRFNPIMLLGASQPQALEAAVFKDAHVEASLVVVNRSKMQIAPIFSLLTDSSSAKSGELGEIAETVAAQSIIEVPLPSAGVPGGAQGGAPRSSGGLSGTGWGGTGWGGVVKLRERLPAGCGVLVMFRDTQTRQPVSAVGF